MNNYSILEKLKILGILKSDQLIKHDLTYWHLKTFRKNYKNKEKLININNAKEELSKFTDKDLQKILENNYIPNKNHRDFVNKQNSESFKTPRTKINENLETIEGIPLNQSNEAKNNVYDTNLNLKNTSKIFLLIFAISIFFTNPILFCLGIIIFLILKN